ncbi:MAG: DUF1343 domain-containing protein [Armatimonadetes bacterium]|nr:DUF1343 domain-containing protein [Armatimonadota bacterium]
MEPHGVAGLIECIGGRRVALLTNPTGWLGEPGHLIDILHSRGLLAALYAPEHGVWGDLQAGEHVSGGVDPRTGVPVHSLYGQVQEPTGDMLAGVDVVVGCLQDAGARPYTYLTTTAACLRACARAGKPLIVFDRPTPLGGEVAQGNVAGGWFLSVPVPMRPALTIGELMLLLRHEEKLDADLTVVPWIEAPRELWYDELPISWVAPSPNLPTLESALCFAGTVVLEATNASEGRGTTRPFELLGAPWCDGQRLAAELNGRKLPGLLARPAAFVPTFSKHKGEVCGGVQLHVTNRRAFDAPRVGLHVLDALRAVALEAFEMNAGGMRFRYHTERVHEQLAAGTPPDEIAAGWGAELTEYRLRARAAGVGPAWWGRV